jgi:Kdo2-lipid IVA lauroyltransferase/acyltransferase
MAKSRTRHNLEQAFMSRLAAGGSWLARRLSLRALRRLADCFALVVIACTGKRQRLADANLAAVFPELSSRERDAIRIASVRNICRTMIELFHLPAMTPEELSSRVRLEAGPLLRETVKERGILFITAHYGNWEWLGARVAQEVPTTVIARDAAHDVTASIINDARASHGMKVIGREDLRRMISVLRSREALGILPDQHALNAGVLMQFLGRPAWSFTGPALLAARTGALVVPVFSVRQDDGTFDIEMLPPLEMVDTGDREADLLTNSQAILDALSDAIRRHPEQWLWLHDRWKMKSPDQTSDAVSEAVE